MTSMCSKLETNGSTKTMNDDGFDFPGQEKSSQGITIIIGGSNSVHSHNVIQVNGDTLKAIAESIQKLPSEVASQLAGPLGELVKAAGLAVSKTNL